VIRTNPRIASIRGDPVQPGAQFRPAVKSFQASQRLDQRFLGEFLGIFGVTQDPKAQRVDPPLIPLHDLARGGSIAVLRTLNELGLVVHHPRRNPQTPGGLDPAQGSVARIVEAARTDKFTIIREFKY